MAYLLGHLLERLRKKKFDEKQMGPLNGTICAYCPWKMVTWGVFAATRWCHDVSANLRMGPYTFHDRILLSLFSHVDRRLLSRFEWLGQNSFVANIQWNLEQENLFLAETK